MCETYSSRREGGTEDVQLADLEPPQAQYSSCLSSVLYTLGASADDGLRTLRRRPVLSAPVPLPARRYWVN